MRVLLQGGDDAALASIAAALRQGGCELARPDEPYDCLLTLRRPASPVALTIDTVRSIAIVAGRAVRLTRTELAILAVLARGHAVSRAELLAAVWGYDFDPGTNLVAVHLSRLRAKLGLAIVTHGAGGYRLSLGCVDSPEAAP